MSRRPVAAALAVATALVATGAVLATQTGTAAPATPTGDDVAWSSLSSPYRHDHRLHFRGAEVRRPETLHAVATTRDTVVISAEVGVITLTADGTRQQVGSRLVGIALADDAGHLTVWSERLDGQRVRTVAYSTRTGRVVGAVRTRDAMQVHAVQEGTVVLGDGQDSYSWSPRSGGRPQLLDPVGRDAMVTDVDADLAFMTDFSGSWLVSLETGAVRQSYRHTFGGTFDPSGRYVALLGGARNGTGRAIVRVLDTMSGTTTPTLDVAYGPDDGTRWDPGGGLIVRTGAARDGITGPDDPVTYSVCSPPAFGCDDLVGGPKTFEGAEGLLPSAFAQLSTRLD